jgi:hypothetical protein
MTFRGGKGNSYGIMAHKIGSLLVDRKKPKLQRRNANKRIEIRDTGWKLRRRERKNKYGKLNSLQYVPLKKKKEEGTDGFTGCFNCNPTFF